MKVVFSSDVTSCDYPPYYFLRQILKNCPKAGYTYFLLWENKNLENKVIIQREEIKSKYFSHLGKFRHDILLLEREGLLNVFGMDFENGEDILIDLVRWDQIEGEGHSLC